MKKSKLTAITALLTAVLLAGIALICVGAGTVSKDKKYMSTAEKADAVISTVLNSDSQREYILSYSVDGEDFATEYGFNKKNGDYVGKDVTVYYTKGAPDKIFIETNKAYFVLRNIGIVLLVIAVLALGFIYIPLALSKYIMKNGKSELVKINAAVDVIGGQKLICDSKKIRGRNAPDFKSKTIKAKITKDMLNSAVTVYYLPKHKSLYYIDTDTIKFRE